MEFRVTQGDIAVQGADVLVNAAGTSLGMGRGVAGFDLREGARIVCETVAGYESESLSDVRVIACGDEEYETTSRVASGVREA